MFNGIDDFYISRTSAQVSPKTVFYLLSCEFRVFIQQSFGRQYHPGCTKTALDSPVVHKGLLKGIQLRTLGKPLNGGYLLSHRIHCQYQAGVYALTIQQDRAGATFPGSITTLFGPGEVELFPQHFKERRSRRNNGLIIRTIYFQHYLKLIQFHPPEVMHLQRTSL